MNAMDGSGASAMTPPAGFNEVDRISRLVLKCPSDAFVSQDEIARQWRNLNFTSPPVLSAAVEEYERALWIAGRRAV